MHVLITRAEALSANTVGGDWTLWGYLDLWGWDGWRYVCLTE